MAMSPCLGFLIAVTVASGEKEDWFRFTVEGTGGSSEKSMVGFMASCV